MYEPLKVFTYVGLLIFGAGLVPAVRFVYLFFTEVTGQRYLPSLIASAILLIVGFQIIMIGLLADVISANRKLLEDLVYRVRSLELPERSVTAEPVAPAAARGERRADDRWER
jgi:hypothetical protein